MFHASLSTLPLAFTSPGEIAARWLTCRSAVHFQSCVSLRFSPCCPLPSLWAVTVLPDPRRPSFQALAQLPSHPPTFPPSHLLRPSVSHVSLSLPRALPAASAPCRHISSPFIKVLETDTVPSTSQGPISYLVLSKKE